MMNHRQQILVLVGLSVAVVLFTAAAYALDRQVFKRFLGSVNPVLASVVIVLVGGVALLVFLARGWFLIYAPWDLGRYFWPAVIAVVLAGLMMLVDSRVVLAEDINALFPQSMFFYPAVGYAAEILFHILPLFLLLSLAAALWKSPTIETLVWPCIILVSLIEPVFQARPMIGQYPTWSAAYVFLNVWIISIVGLTLFQRYDFVSMYAFRLMYYLLWHIIWGHFRLKWLF
jgi:hypothetical protein